MKQQEPELRQQSNAHVPPRAAHEKKEEKIIKEKPARSFAYWLRKNRYYHHLVTRFYRCFIPRGASVLQVNCKNGYLLGAVEPSYGVGVDDDEACIAHAHEQYPDLAFYQCRVRDIPVSHQFDYVILSLVTMETDDIQRQLEDIRPFCHAGTRILVETYSRLWQPILWLSKKLGMRRPTRFKNWLSGADLENMLYISGFERVTRGSYCLMPIYIPLISSLFNCIIANIPFINRLCLLHWMITRPINARKPVREVTASVIIPCRNEAGNIEDAITRTPLMGAHTELIFVEGNSTDNTREQIRAMQDKYAGRDIKFFVQEGKGKGDAVRKGFAHASGDVLMILDADLTMPPEELPKFFDALVNGRGECINGSRMIYGMESEAMTRASYCANFGISVLVSWVLGQRVKDTLCGTKVLWRTDYEQLAAQRGCFGFADPFGDFDLLFGAAKLNLKIVDVPVHYKRRTYGATNINRIRDVWLLWWMGIRAIFTLKIRW